MQQPWRHFTSLKLCQYSQIPQQPPRVTSTSNRIKTTTIGLIIYKHSTRTRLHHLTSLQWLRGSSRTPGKTQGNLALTFLPHSLDLTSETKRLTLDLPSVLVSFSYTRNTEKNSNLVILGKTRLTRVTNNRAVSR